MIPTLQLYDTAHNKLCGLTNYSDLYVEQAIGTSTTPIVLDQLHFKYALEDSNYHLIIPECYIATEDAEYVIKERNVQTAEGGTSGPTWVEYVCDLNIEPLKGTLLGSFTPGSVLAEDAANLALAGTGWAVGYSDITKRRTAAATNCTVFEALEDISKAYGCEVTFDASRKQVILHQQQGADRGAYFAEELNLKTLQVQSNSRDYVTRLYPIGKDGMTIASVNGGVPYVSNYQYSTKIGHDAYWIDNRYTVPADMLADAQDRLGYLSSPTTAYAANIVDLVNASDGKYQLLDYGIGDTITLLAYSVGVRAKQRIVKIDRYYDGEGHIIPEKTTCEVSNKIASLDDIVLRVSDAADAIDAATDSTGAIMGGSVQVTNPDGSYSTLNAAVATIGTLIAAKAKITDLTAATARITTLEATSVTTTYLTANYLTADSIRASYATIGDLNVQTARIDNLVTSQITTDYLEAHYADIDLSNIGTGIIQTAMIATGAVQTAQIANGSITDAKIVGLTANKITAGTIDASKITVTNLNCANLTVGTINGQQIASGAIDTSKLTSSLNSTISTAASNASSALSAASAAQSTANGKNTAYYQASAPSGGAYKVNDVWYDTDDGYKMYYYSGSAWTAAALGNDAIVTLDAGKITTGYLAAARIAASTITGTMIAGTTITAANIATNTITATQIATGTITATQIASRTITADRIVAGAITANEIAAHTITATQIAANTITAAQIAAGTITADKLNVTNLAVYKIVSQTNSNNYATMTPDNAGGMQFYNQWNGATPFLSIAGYSPDNGTTYSPGILGTSTLGVFSSNFANHSYIELSDADADGDISLFISSGVSSGSAASISLEPQSTRYNSHIYLSATQLTFTGLATFASDVTFSQAINGCTIASSSDNSLYSSSWPAIPVIKTSGGMEVGHYLDFHMNSNDSSDYAARIIANSDGSLSMPNINTGVITVTGGLKWSNGRYALNTGNIGGMDFAGDNSYVQITRANGGAYGINIFASDRRLKTNIIPATLDALGEFRRFTAVQFDWIATSKHQSVGFVAQDMEAVDPATVLRIAQPDGTDLCQLDSTYLLPLTMRAVQQVDGNVIALAQRVDSLTTRDDYQDNEIALLNAQIAAMQARVAALEAEA